MQNKTKNIIVTIGFVVILMATFVINLISKDQEISISERRKLAQFPEITVKKILNGDAMEDWDDYVDDQFIERDFFRKIKAFWSTNVFGQKDNNNLFEKDEAIYKMEYPLKEKNVQKSAQKIKNVYDTYLKDMNVYYSIIPDKNHYLQNDDHLKIDFDKVEQIVGNELKDFKYIDITQGLELEDYYKTDLHWKQENLDEVVGIIQNDMGLDATTNIDYELVDKGEFYGTYYGQYGQELPPDELYVLTNETIENCTTYNVEKKKTAKIYTETKSADRYDIFVSGATPLIEIKNPNAKTDKELLLFRDSFGSSLAPLLVENYSKITLVDIRYMSSKILGEFIDFEDQDVLFLYSTVVLNQNILK